ncbi:MAG: PEP-CTERM sorting domain-containing protein [Thermoguttaceae bacterium]|nr:PEP-CTERM sorting domain-containing protein [Thermoguttaceae bacterium]
MGYQGAGGQWYDPESTFLNKNDSITSNIAISVDNVSFTQFANRVIVCTNGSISGINSNSEILFSGNSVSGLTTDNGGAIYADNLQISTGKFTFQNNFGGRNDYGGGAIYCSDTLTFSGANTTATFTGNTGGVGGAIKVDNNAQFLKGVYTFQNNTTGQWASSGGAIRCNATVTFSDATATFIGNSANSAGAIHADNVQLSNGKYTFENNSMWSYGNGGAIRVFNGVTISNATATFIGNSAEYGGAISGPCQFSNGVYLFQNNKATNGSGGALYTTGSITFSGDDNTATFTGNIASSGNGNDIYTWLGPLTFTDRGKYYFDGGIFSEQDFYDVQTSINQAQVTIAGRQYRPDDPTVEDTTNNYVLKNTTISNGGTLTANMDYINQLTGKFTFSGAESLITMNKGSDTATIKSSTGRGVASLNFISATDVETISISSGRIDAKGAMSASIELQNDATFSPGNSVGTLDLDGDFIANSGILLFEQDATGMDKLIANSYTIGNGVQLQLVFDAPLSEDTYTMYDIIVANDGFTTEQSDVSFWEALLTGALPEGMVMSVVNGNTVRLEIGPKPVPEPTTWALLVLGVTGLLYVRQRKN